MRDKIPSKVLRGLFLAAVGIALVTGGCGSSDPGGPSGWDYVLVPEKPHFGATYAVWSQRWAQWANELPFTNHPLFDPTGEHAAVGQVNPVWFLGGIFGSLYAPTDGSAIRDITVPAGIALFFPIINVSWTNQECVDPDMTLSYTDLRGLCASLVENYENIHCVIDGTPIIDSPDLPGAVRFRAQAEEFSYTIPADNIFNAVCGDPAVVTVHDPVALDGIWMMVALPLGLHTITFEGTYPGPPLFHLNITYHITVTP